MNTGGERPDTNFTNYHQFFEEREQENEEEDDGGKWEQRGKLGLLRNEWLVRQVTARETAWGNYGFCYSPNDKIANSVSKSNFGSAFVTKEELPEATIGVVVRSEPTGPGTRENPNPFEVQISHPPWQVSQRSRRTRYCQADWH